MSGRSAVSPSPWLSRVKMSPFRYLGAMAAVDHFDSNLKYSNAVVVLPRIATLLLYR
jgi:hypothetical protein